MFSLFLWLLGFYSWQGPRAAGTLSSAPGHQSSPLGKALCNEPCAGLHLPPLHICPYLSCPLILLFQRGFPGWVNNANVSYRAAEMVVAQNFCPLGLLILWDFCLWCASITCFSAVIGLSSHSFHFLSYVFKLLPACISREKYIYIFINIYKRLYICLFKSW